MRTLRLTLAYDGTNYAGWQRQDREPSVQQAVEEAFVPLVSGGGEAVTPPTVVAAGRTDAGVHALGQVASVNVDFDLSASAVQRALNVRLPTDIRVVGVVDAPQGFHARYHAVGKTYRYRIGTTPVLSPFDRHFVFHYPGRLDVAAMRASAALLVGRHDFASFQTVGSWPLDTTRTIHRLDVSETAGRSRSTSKATGSSGTWCARSPGRCSKSERGSDRPKPSTRCSRRTTAGRPGARFRRSA